MREKWFTIANVASVDIKIGTRLKVRRDSIWYITNLYWRKHLLRGGGRINFITIF